MKHIAKKKFGQNFLIDQDIIQSLINAIHPHADDLMVEIGPGLGAMTQPLIKRLDHLHVVEIDRDIIQWMQGFYPPKKITILFKLLENTSQIIDMHFMLQKEVVERMVAQPSTAEYGRLSVMLQYRLQMEYLITVPPEAFDPAPKVESAFVRCVPFASLPFPASDEALFAKVVTAAFGQRRKTLRNTLKGLLDDAGFTALNIDSQLRAENLGVAEFVAISNYLASLPVVQDAS